MQIIYNVPKTTCFRSDRTILQYTLNRGKQIKTPNANLVTFKNDIFKIEYREEEHASVWCDWLIFVISIFGGATAISSSNTRSILHLCESPQRNTSRQNQVKSVVVLKQVMHFLLTYYSVSTLQQLFCCFLVTIARYSPIAEILGYVHVPLEKKTWSCYDPQSLCFRAKYAEIEVWQ